MFLAMKECGSCVFISKGFVCFFFYFDKIAAYISFYDTIVPLHTYSKSFQGPEQNCCIQRHAILRRVANAFCIAEQISCSWYVIIFLSVT